MPLTVTILLPDQTPLEAGVALDLLSAGEPVATATTIADGTATFSIDPGSLATPAVRVSSQQPQPSL